MTSECATEIQRLIKDYGLTDQHPLHAETIRPVVMVDLDSTLADSRHRSPLLAVSDGQPANWERYALASGDDDPILPVVKLVDLLSPVCDIHIVSGRHWASREVTVEWLLKHDIYYDVLALCPDTELHVYWKLMWRDAIQELGYTVDLLIDDHPIFREAMDPTPVVVINPGFY